MACIIKGIYNCSVVEHVLILDLLRTFYCISEDYMYNYEVDAVQPIYIVAAMSQL